ncbi:MAG: HDIG domain-containing protein [Desulfovibrio sp.]|nr:HDIG domain-containing protein [Desulfovibrio sp.]
MTAKKKNSRQTSFLTLYQILKERHKCGWSLWILVASLLFLSLVASINFDTTHRVYLAGQIADRDIVSDREMLVLDEQATEARKKQIQSRQPPVYDLTLEPYLQFQSKITEILRILNNLDPESPVRPPSLSRLKEELGASADQVLQQLTLPEVQTCLLKRLLPLIHDRMASGMVSDIRTAQIGRSGVFIHNLDNNTEILRPEVSVLPDLHSFLAEISIQLKQDKTLSPASRHAIYLLLSTTLPPASLTLNREATQKSKNAVLQNIEPVYYQIQKGERILRKGDKVSREQEIKLKMLFKYSTKPFDIGKSFGIFLCSLLFSIGFFVAPSGKPGSSLQRKDMLLISLFILFFSLGAKGIYLFAMRFNDMNLLTVLTAAYPVAGGVGLITMVFSARRYCTMGFLLSFFSMLMLEAPWEIFLYYFLGSMLFTWLVANTLNRQDAVWSVVPLTIGQMVIWMGISLLSQQPSPDLPTHLTAVAVNSVLSLILLFAVSPVLELAFGYTTRFRLMELMSLEQPLMQELMVSAPGTYHHSLIVANMVEAGAKAIGANSLLCKVSALYHDIGKISYPEYFIENQFGGVNRHDKLAPSMSALILLSHVKKGTELALQNNLGQDIANIIQQHHGTRIMQFFYQKAINLGEKPNESDFCYTGPRPQTRESAILMLADSVEASSRTLSDPTPARIKTHIDNIIKGIFAEGQLDESELTFKDLHHLSDNFQRILTGIFHQRIEYPDQTKNVENTSSNSQKNK